MKLQDAIVAIPQDVNPRQKKSMCLLLENAWEWSTGRRPDDYEFKRLEFYPTEYGTYSVSLEIGGINDEGTMAEVFARNSWFVFIGKRGGWYTYSRKGSTRYYWHSITKFFTS